MRSNFDRYGDPIPEPKRPTDVLSPRKALAVIGAVLVAAILLVHVWNGLGSTDNGRVGVAQNGGWFDNSQVRVVDGVPQVLGQGSSLTWVGAWSTVYQYPATDRFWTVDIDGGDTNQAITVPTREGTSLGITGSFHFQLNDDPEALAAFHTRFGTRTYPLGDTSYYPWDGDEGWNAFLNATFPPVVFNVLSSVVGQESCANLRPGCQILQANAGPNAIVDANAPIDAGTRGRVQDAVNRQFGATLRAANLVTESGKPIFTATYFTFSGAQLPGDLEQKIRDYQGKAAETAAAQADVATASARSEEQRQRQAGYQACPACAEQDTLRSLPPGLTTYAPGSGFAVTAGGR